MATGYAGEGRGSLYEIKFDGASRGANLSFLSQYPMEAELLFPPGTMLSCMGEKELPEPGKRLLEIRAAYNPDTKLKEVVAPIRTHLDQPGERTALPPLYVLVVAQRAPVLVSHVRASADCSNPKPGASHTIRACHDGSICVRGMRAGPVAHAAAAEAARR